MLQSINLVNPDGSSRPFYFRGTIADRGVITQQFEKNDYSIARLRRGQELNAHYQRLISAGRRPLVIDAGANIGASVIYFSYLFPLAHFVAIEPATDNFELLERNLAGLDVDLRRAALAANDGDILLVDPGLGEWGYRTAAAGDGYRVPLLAASRLIEEKIAAGLVPFIAKIDIEGGEDALFASDTDWIDQFPLLIIELHDWLMPGKGSARNFLRCVAERDRDFVHIGENVFSIRNGPAPARL